MWKLAVCYRRDRDKARMVATETENLVPKQRGRPHHHSVRERRLRQRGLQLPDPIIPSGHFGLPYVPRIIPPGWRLRSAPFMRENGAIVLIFAALALLTFTCVAGATLLSAITR
jgi:hypothetical protein